MVSVPKQHQPERIERPSGLDPALLRIIQAMARADARRDYDAAQAASAQGLRPDGA